MVKVVLFGNTGLANGVFRALVEHESIKLCAVYTRKLPGNFPYYPEKELWEAAEEYNIPTVIGQNVNSNDSIAYLSDIAPDYIIVSSFDQIVKSTVIELAKFGIINFHPSLLPKYRGPNPISWVLINGEKKTGLTIHQLTKGIDSGDILYQENLDVDSNDNLGSLYFKLSALAESMSKVLVEDIATKGLPVGDAQDETNMSYYAKSTVFRYVDLNAPLNDILNKIRAFQPFPKPMLKINEKDYLISDVAVMGNTSSKRLGLSDDSVELCIKKEESVLNLAITAI